MLTNKPIAIGSDHAGFEYKEKLKDVLLNNGYKVLDFGAFSTESADYPDHVHPLANAIERDEHDFGILICGSGIGVCITANKHQKVRAALCWQNEIAALSRQHNNANVICFAQRFMDFELVEEMTYTFLTTEFEGGRHERRVKKISC